MTDELEPGFELLPTRPRRSHGRLISSIAAVVVLGAGGAVSYVAFAAGDSGASSPTKAVQNVVADLQKADLVGVLDDLAPGERDALTAPIRDDIASLKRLGVAKPSTDPSSVPGVHFAAHQLRYGKPIVVNDHVQVVPITGGSVDLNAAAAKLPFTQRFLKLAKAPTAPATKHLDITSPVRVAAQKVGHTWYASIFYTAADDAADHAIPAAADRIAAEGATSPQTAVEKTVHSLLTGDLSSALALVSPAELGAVHDYGAMILRAGPKSRPTGLTIKTLHLTTTPISKGVRVGLKQLVVASGGRQVSIAIDRDCATVSALGLHRKLCAADAANVIAGVIGSFGCLSSSFSSYGSSAYHSRLHVTVDGRGQVTRNGSSEQGGSGYVPLSGITPGGGCHGPTFTAPQKQAIGHLLAGLMSLGVDTAEIDGTWFLSPVRTVADAGATMLKALQGDDLFQLATLGR